MCHNSISKGFCEACVWRGPGTDDEATIGVVICMAAVGEICPGRKYFGDDCVGKDVDGCAQAVRIKAAMIVR